MLDIDIMMAVSQVEHEEGLAKSEEEWRSGLARSR